jgi:hypothetical protein
MTLPTTAYDTAIFDSIPNSGTELGFTLLVDLANMSETFDTNWDDSDGTKGRAARHSNGEEFATDWIDVDDTAKTGTLRIFVPGAMSAGFTVRVYPPNSANSSYAASDPYGSENAYDEHTEMYLPLVEDPSGSAPQAIDRTSNNNDGTSAGTMLTGDLVAGQVGNAWDFDGTDDVCNIPDSAELRPGAGGFTWSCWFNHTNVAADEPIMHKAQLSGVYDIAGISVGTLDSGGNLSATKKISALIRDDGSDRYYFNTDADVIDGNTHHLAFMRDGTGAYIYIDGVSVATTAVSDLGTGHQSPVDNTEQFTIARQNTGSTFFAGWIDDVRIDSKERSADWIKQEYDQANDNGAFWNIGTGTWRSSTRYEAGKHFLDLSLTTPGSEASGYTGIALSATTSASPDIIHTSSSTVDIVDEVHVFVNNTSAGALDVTFQTATGAGADRTELATISVPAKTELISVIPGLILSDGYRLEAYAPTTPSSINIFGFVNRIDQNT